MIRIGDVHCDWCGDTFEPEGLPNFDEPNYCSEDCSEGSVKAETAEAHYRY